MNTTPSSTQEQQIAQREAPPAAEKNGRWQDFGIHTLTPEAVGSLCEKLNEARNMLLSGTDRALSSAERQRMYGPGAHLFGFILKAHDIMSEAPEFMPEAVSPDDMNRLMADVNALTTLMPIINELQQMANDMLLRNTTHAYRLARLYYHSLQYQARAQVPGAEALYNRLNVFYEKKKKNNKPLTKKQITRTAHALIKGTKDGSLTIENQRPKQVGGFFKEEFIKDGGIKNEG